MEDLWRLRVYLQDDPKEEEINERPAEEAAEEAAVPEKSVLYFTHTYLPIEYFMS